MTWLKVDDKLTFHAKILRAKNAAVGAWVRMGAWCAERESDGIVPADVVELIASPAELAKLLEVGLLHALLDGSYELHDFLKYNPSKAELDAQRAQWSARRGSDRRKVSHVVSHSDTTSDTRERLSERPTETPGRVRDSLSGSDLVPDPEPEEPASHRASSPRLKSVPPPAPDSNPPPPESVEPEESNRTTEPRAFSSPEKPIESGYDLARRVFAELWAEKYQRPFPFDPFDAGPKSEKRVLQAFGNLAVERGGPRAEEYARHWVKAYLRSRGDRDWLVEHSHPARTLMRDVASFGDPVAPKPARVAPARASPAEAPALSAAEVASKLRASGIGKIGMGGAR